jgi:hypothetical protein
MSLFSKRPKKTKPPKTSQRVWGLGILIGDRQKTVVRAADYPRITEGLERAYQYSLKNPNKRKRR